MKLSIAASFLALSAVLVDNAAAFMISPYWSNPSLHTGVIVNGPSEQATSRPQTCVFMGDDSAEAKTIDDVTADLKEVKRIFDEKLAAAESSDDMEAIQRDYLGKKSPISAAMGFMRVLADEDKPKLGAAVTKIKSTVEEAMANRMKELGLGELKSAKAPKKAKKQQDPPVPDGPIDVSKLDMRVGVIIKAWEHEEADKLFCEEIDIGEGQTRQIASGLRAHYKLEDIEGQRVLVLANLKSRKLMGFPSHGMVMCAANEDGSKVEFVEPPADAAIGERVMVEGFDGEPATENQVIKKKMLDAIFPDLKTNSEGVPMYKGKPFMTSAGACKAQNGMPDAEVA